MLTELCSLKALKSFLASSRLLGLLASSASRHITATSFLLHFTISRRRNQAAPSTLCLETSSTKWSGSSLTSSTFHPTVEQAVSPGNSEFKCLTYFFPEVPCSLSQLPGEMIRHCVWISGQDLGHLL